MLPDVEAENRDAIALGHAGHQGVVLVRRRTDAESATRLHAEPRPAGAEPGRAGVGERSLHFVHRAERRVDRGHEFRARGARVARGSEDRPEEAVVEVAATVVADRATDRVGKLGDVSAEIVDRMAGEVVVAFKRRVQLRDVGRVVLGMMDVHGPRVDRRLEGGFGVGKFGKGEGHGGGSGGFGVNRRAAAVRHPWGDDSVDARRVEAGRFAC